jgi:putative endonuclease
VLPNWLRSIFSDDEQDAERANLGMQGETLAARHLQALKYHILVRNFRVPAGEIDIIARENKVLVFVEVKTRASADLVAPEQQVNNRKQEQVKRVAKQYLSRYGTVPPPYRYDIIAITATPNGKPEINHLVNAYTD